MAGGLIAVPKRMVFWDLRLISNDAAFLRSLSEIMPLPSRQVELSKLG